MVKMLKYVLHVLLVFVEINCSRDVKSSLTFVIDSSGSMHNVIDQIKRDVDSIFDTVMNSNVSQIEDFVLVTFDETVRLRAVTKDRHTFKNALKVFQVDGGGLCPELAMTGIELALMNSRDASSLYIFTDASAEDYDKFEKIEALSQKMRSQLVFVMTDDCGSRDEIDYLVYPKLAKATQGQVFRLEHYEIEKILKYVKNTISSRKNMITSKTYPAGYGHKFDVDVDGDTKELVIAVSGLNPSVGVKDFEGIDITTEDITRLTEIAVVKVRDARPGHYRVEVGSDSETYVVVSGTTTVHFQHGFSVFEPTAITDTATRPIPGEKSYLSIELATEGKVELQSLQLLDMDDNVIEEKPLRLLDETERLYTTDPIIPPNVMFRIAIKGYDKDSSTYLTRLSLTPIKPQESVLSSDLVEKAPVVSIDGGDKIEAEFSKHLQLKCKVSGYPKPNITWTSDDPTPLSHTESVVELPNYFLSVLHIKNVTKSYTYTCNAVNKVNTDFKSVAVQIKRKHVFDVLKIPKDTAIEYERPGQLFCKVSAFPAATVYWYKGRRPLVTDSNVELSADNSTLTIRSMEPYVAGDYICEIRNDFDRKMAPFTVSITGVEKPKINKNDYQIEKLTHSSVDIKCKVFRGKPKPTFSWFYSKDHSISTKHSKLNVTADTIHIDNLGMDHNGKYTCRATNFIGSDSHDIYLIVEYPPLLTASTSARVAAREGDAVTLPCPADGAPLPDFTWRRDGVELTPDSYTLFRDGSLRFIATLASKGRYECKATNHHGSVLMHTYLDVDVPVSIEIPKGSKKSVMVGDNLELHCRAKGFPEPTISWIFLSKGTGVKPQIFMPSDSSGSLYLNRIQQKQDGFYTCVAKNAASSKNITYTVDVSAPPSITFTKKEFTAVIDDVLLRIPCNASGNPRPTIIWKKDGFDIPLGQWYDVEDGNLIIKNIDTKAAGIYTCEASNRFGKVHETFEAIVKSYPFQGSIGDPIWLEETKSANVFCNVAHRKTDRLRWFKNGMIISKQELSIKKVTRFHSGVYTCRVSSVTGEIQTGSVKVEVGSKPQFMTEEEKNIKFEPEGIALMSCDVSGKPTPQIQWLHDDEPLYVTSFTHEVQMISSRDKGRYKCVVSNMFGSVQREFVIKSYECELDVKKDFDGDEPLMLTRTLDMNKFIIFDGHMRIHGGEFITLFCPATFMKIPRRQIMVQCENGKEFIYDRRRFSHSHLKCRQKLSPMLKGTGRRCVKDDSEMMSVGFEIPDRFMEVYQVCLDRATKTTIYTYQNITLSQANVVPEYDIKWFNSGSAVDLDRLYDCGYQNNRISSTLRKGFHTSDACCFAQRQLVSPRDVAPGLPQTATYTHLNVAPHWGTCNSQNWEEVEERVRTLVKVLRRELLVWTGTAGRLQLPDARYSPRDIFLNDGYTDYLVPIYFWKVVQDPAENKSLAIVQVNVPDLRVQDASRYRLCSDVCAEVDWMRFGKSWRILWRGFTYCCKLDDFERAFGLTGVFPPHDRLLKNVY